MEDITLYFVNRSFTSFEKHNIPGDNRGQQIAPHDPSQPKRIRVQFDGGVKSQN